MPRGNRSDPNIDFSLATVILRAQWEAVAAACADKPDAAYVSDTALREAIRTCINHEQVSYRFCLPVQLLGKLTNPSLDCLRLQRREGDPNDIAGWDARSLGRNVVSRFNKEQEYILGTSRDPYVGNPMRIPRMVRNDPSKRDVPGWNVLVDVLEQVQSQSDALFTTAVFRQVLLEMYRRQQSLCFVYELPTRISLKASLGLARQFLEEKSGGDRAVALCGALFDAIGIHFGLYAHVNRARINASDEATGLAADLECVNAEGRVLLAVEVKDRTLTMADVEGTLQKSHERAIQDIFFAAPGVKYGDQPALELCIAKSFQEGRNLYIFDFLDLARSVLALGGEPIRSTFLRKVGEHLDTWNTQPANRQAWKRLLDTL